MWRPVVQDELATTKRSYEDQLSMMSDHLCSMNETLSKQREEIDTLKLGSKVQHSDTFLFLSALYSLSVRKFPFESLAAPSQVCFQLSPLVSRAVNKS